jgi:hypothetical protein
MLEFIILRYTPLAERTHQKPYSWPPAPNGPLGSFYCNIAGILQYCNSWFSSTRVLEYTCMYCNIAILNIAQEQPARQAAAQRSSSSAAARAFQHGLLKLFLIARLTWILEKSELLGISDHGRCVDDGDHRLSRLTTSHARALTRMDDTFMTIIEAEDLILGVKMYFQTRCERRPPAHLAPACARPIPCSHPVRPQAMSDCDFLARLSWCAGLLAFFAAAGACARTYALRAGTCWTDG